MEKIVTCFLIFSALVFNSIAQTIQWEKSLGGSSDEYSNSSTLTFDGGNIVAGYSLSNDGNVTGNQGGKDYWVVKLDNTGAIQWQQNYGGSLDDVASSIQQTADSGYIVAGYSNSNDGDVSGHHGLGTSSDYWIIKLTHSGAIQWQTSLGGTDYDVAESIRQTSDSGYIVAGFTQSADDDVSFNHGASDYWVVKLYPSGNIQWENSFGGTGNDNAMAIQQTHDTGYIIAGSTNSTDNDVSFNHGLFDYWLVKITPNGILQWEKSYGGSNSENPSYIEQTSDSGYIISGTSFSSDGDVTPYLAGPEVWILKTDVNGNIQWKKSLGGQGSDEAYAVHQNADSSYIVAGRSASMDGDVTGNHGVWDSWLLKLSSMGALLWENCFGGPWDDGATEVKQTADGGFIFTGHAKLNGGDVSGNHGGHDFWVVRLSATTNIDVLNIYPDFTIYPNPSGNEIHIYTTDKNQYANYSVTDLTGNKVIYGKLERNTGLIQLTNLKPGYYIFTSGLYHKQILKIKP